jgi:hypothetical protein
VNDTTTNPEETLSGKMLTAAGFFPSNILKSWMKGSVNGVAAQIADGLGGLGKNLDVNSGTWCASVYDDDDDGRCVYHQAVGLTGVIEWCNAALADPEPFFAANAKNTIAAPIE